MLQYIQNKLYKNIDFCLFAIIIFIVFWVYHLSLSHAPRADQIIYLNCISDRNDLKSLTIGSYALNRECGGDGILFRPILYFFLGFEKWLFGYQFTYWQLTGILLHLLVLFVFYTILKFNPGLQDTEDRREIGWSQFLAFGITLLFGIQYFSMEMVVWHHINAYILFTFFALVGILYLRYFLSERKTLYLGISFASIFLSAFTYELGSVAGFLIAVYLFCLSRDKSLKKIGFWHYLPFLLIPILYMGLSLFDLHNRGYTTIPFPNYFVEVPSINTGIGLSFNSLREALVNFFFKPLVYTLLYITIWVTGGIIPSLYELKSGGRIRLAPQLPNFSPISIFLIIIMLSLAIVLFKTREVNRKRLKEESSYFVFLSFLLVAYTEIIIYGRTLAKGWQNILANNLYYAYFFNIILFLSAYQFLTWCTDSLPLRKSIQSFLQFYLIFVITCTTVANGSYIYAMNIEMTDFGRPILVLLERTLKTIEMHSQEPDFFFKVEEGCQSNFVLEWLNSYTLVEAIFPKFYSEENYKYIVSCKE